MAYWDTSCLVKLYAPEPDSAVIRAHVVAGVTVVTSEFARLELWATLRRKESAGDLHSGGARQALATYDGDIAGGLILVETMSPRMIARFEAIIEQCNGRIPPLPLRTLDAIHLSTAAASNETEIVATDRRLREAAVSLGFSIFPPP